MKQLLPLALLALAGTLTAGRYALVPYIYTMAREAHETGISLCRPLYYEYPEAEEAYSYRSEYFFGDQMLIAPITQPADADGLVTLSVWLPEGEWFDVAKGELITSDGRPTDRTYSLDEYPVFVKGGSILPYYEDAHNGFKGQSQRLQAAVADYKQTNAGLVYTPEFGTLENTALRLQYHPEDADAILANFRSVRSNLPAVLHEQMQNDDHESRFLRLLK